MRLALLSLFVPCVATAGGFQRLYAEEATASSFLQSNWNKYQENYHPNYALDDDPKTAWVEGAEGEGLGESLTIPLSNLASARAVRLVIYNGYQKSKALLEANAAPETLTVTVRGPAGQESGRKQLTLARKMGPQSFDIPVTGGVVDVVLKVDSVHPGSKYLDTCVSDVQVFVDGDVPYKAAAEKSKHEALLKWKKERLATAKYYASLPRTYPYVSTRFEEKTDSNMLSQRYLTPEKEDPQEGDWVKDKSFVPLMEQVRKGTVGGGLAEADKALLKELSELSTGKARKGPWYSLSRRGKTVPPENFSLPEYVEPLLHLGDATLFEAEGEGGGEPKLSDGEYGSGHVLSNLLVLEGTGRDVKKVYFTYREVVVDRTASSETTHAIATFEGGQMVRMVSLGTIEDDVEGPITTVSVTVPTYVQGKVSKLVNTQLIDREGNPDIGADDSLGITEVKTTLEGQTRS